MELKKSIKKAFYVIGKEGSTEDGEGFVSRLWEEANSLFDEVSALARRNEKGVPVGIWGAMTDMSRGFKPWEDGFSRGRYLAGVETEDEAEAPEGWSKWRVPAFEYLYVKNEGGYMFNAVMEYFEKEGIELAGAAQDFTDPGTGETYIYFPIKRL